MKRVLTVILVFFCFFRGMADEAAVHFEQANQAYRNAEFQQAITMYEQILASGQENPALYYNLGNAYFKTQNIPAAVLNYERARRLAPSDDDIGYNLHLANLRVIDKIEPVPELFFIQWWQALLSFFSTEGWGIVGIVSLWCVALAAACMIVARSYIIQRVMIITLLVTLTISIVSFTSMYQRYHIEQVAHNAIVFAASVSVKSAPDKQSTDLFVLHEGVKVELLDEVGIWRKIRLADGKMGWLPNDAINVI